MERVVIVGKTYKHFKGNLYKVLCIATDSETNEEVVVYEALYGKHLIWTRPYDMFNSLVDRKKYPNIKQKYRFEEIRKEDINESK